MDLIPVPRVAVIVVAAGSGTRLAGGAPKAFVGIDGSSILRHALDGIAAAPPAQVVIVVPSGREGDARTEALSVFGDRNELVTVVAGGATRQQSVAAGLAALWADVDTVLVHDAARALTPPAVFARVIDEVRRSGAGVIPMRPVVDTLKRVADAVVTEAVDRTPLVAAQTPQGFPRAALEDAYARAGAEHTDDAALFAAAGHEVRTVDGDDLSFKITTPADLDRARHLLRSGAPAASAAPLALPRVGTGTDVHAFGGDAPLRLAGLTWPGEPGLRGHSDGDAVAHAIVDAVLSAAGLGDIGTHFGVDRPEFAGATGEVFLRRTAELVAEAGFAVGNVSVQVQANRPRFSARRAEAEAVLSAALGAPVSVAATTTDGLGFTGAGEGVSATAVALVHPAR
ncbi:2-C-methyl-D-erythritol 4-phosphate cytidylyltransferase [Microbacterium radiodurans]|uniref:Bifunctional enzyme IspD/IspF n=1 Tax=Microbacterium radiodurans TaxID=661398 RepID=A0A5J5ITM4_9MICO|nr:2-C-methyl-D-erythritol 4-phosphate cytidylyltransferase [Microbacterium radiodurans]KAA9085359.1 2-C-methyl-D-erythritol 2,4-cyclodiphosphate synthase [Microbacterium radiodurans]